MAQKRHILVVDDDPVVSSFLEGHLTGEGFRVTIADNCAEGKKALAGAAHIDAMILDQFLPDGLGIGLLQGMTQDDGLQKPPVVVSSSWVVPDDPTWEEILHRLPAVSQSLVQAFIPKSNLFESVDTVLNLVFENNLGAPPPKTILSGDYRHPRKK